MIPFVIVVVAFSASLVWILFEFFTRERPSVHEPEKRCVMCDRRLLQEDESKRWIGAHEWCETYY